MIPPLDLRLAVSAGCVHQVAVRNPRPSVAALLTGRPLSSVDGLVSAVFAVCGMAHRTAARLAIAVARGENVAVTGAEAEAIAVEAVQEHLRRLLIDWPAFFGYPPAVDLYARLFRAAAAGDRAGARAIGSHPLIGSVEADLHRLDQTGPPGFGVPDLTLPALSGRAWWRLLGRVPAEAFCRAPMVDGRPADVGPVARHRAAPAVAALLNDNLGICARYRALLADLDMWAGPRPASAMARVHSPRPGIGLAVVETARGPLMHAIAIDAKDVGCGAKYAGMRVSGPAHGAKSRTPSAENEEYDAMSDHLSVKNVTIQAEPDGAGAKNVRNGTFAVANGVNNVVGAYAICAPTEWSFHCRGVFARAVTGLRGTGADIRDRAGAFALALDPCLPFTVDLREMADA